MKDSGAKMDSERISPIVFISYSHDSPLHRERVLAFAQKLREDGIDARLDRFVDPPEGWARWTAKEIERADFVLAVCTAVYASRFLGGEPAVTEGRGSRWEALLLTQKIYERGGHNSHIIPILFDELGDEHIPAPLKGTRYYYMEASYESLYRRLTNQPEVVPAALGPIRKLPLLPAGKVVSSGIAESSARLKRITIVVGAAFAFAVVVFLGWPRFDAERWITEMCSVSGAEPIPEQEIASAATLGCAEAASLADTLYARCQHDAAFALVERVLEAPSASPCFEALAAKAQLLARVGRCADALSIFDRALKSGDGDADFHRARATCALREGDSETAKSSIQTACRLGGETACDSIAP
jgi:hypothetical protein